MTGELVAPTLSVQTNSTTDDIPILLKNPDGSARGRFFYHPGTGRMILRKYDDSSSIESDIWFSGDEFKYRSGDASYNVWHEGKLRWNNGTLEYNDGGTWKPVSGVKSVQRGYTSIPRDSSGTLNVTISAVNVDKSYILLPSMLNWGGSSRVITAEIVDSTTINIYYDSSSNNTSPLRWQVVENY